MILPTDLMFAPFFADTAPRIVFADYRDIAGALVPVPAIVALGNSDADIATSEQHGDTWAVIVPVAYCGDYQPKHGNTILPDGDRPKLYVTDVVRLGAMYHISATAWQR